MKKYSVLFAVFAMIAVLVSGCHEQQCWGAEEPAAKEPEKTYVHYDNLQSLGNQLICIAEKDKLFGGSIGGYGIYWPDDHGIYKHGEYAQSVEFSDKLDNINISHYVDYLGEIRSEYSGRLVATSITILYSDNLDSFPLDVKNGPFRSSFDVLIHVKLLASSKIFENDKKQQSFNLLLDALTKQKPLHFKGRIYWGINNYFSGKNVKELRENLGKDEICFAVDEISEVKEKK